MVVRLDAETSCRRIESFDVFDGPEAKVGHCKTCTIGCCGAVVYNFCRLEFLFQGRSHDLLESFRILNRIDPGQSPGSPR
jgi:hypothetical protein